MMKGIIIGVLVVFVFGGGILWFLGKNGLFVRPHAEERVMGPYMYAVKDFTGPYAKTFPVFKRVYETLTQAGIENTIGIGFYYDNPKETPANQLRSSCGSVIRNEELSKAALLGLKTGVVPEKMSVVIEFPVHSALSYMIAPAKCYAVLEKYISEKGYQQAAPFEIYDIPSKKMYVIMEIAR